MGQELYTLGCMLHTNANKMMTGTRRLSWMDGSDSDDEDQHSQYSVRKEVEKQPSSVFTIFIV
jgi:hypothetical protein